MEKYLSDSEILKWNDRLKDTPYLVFAKYHTHSSQPLIVFKQKTTQYGSFIPDPHREVITLDPSMKFNFSFSVAKNRIENFFHIFDKWFSNKIVNKTYFEDSNNREKITEILVTNKIIKSKTQTEHKLKDKEYVRFSYEFEGHLSSIMAYVMFLEDTINIFSNIWGYDESGNEHVLSKFSIGDIVSKIEDQSEDYLILDFSPIKIDKKLFIDYEISRMIQKGQIIQYDKSEVVSEKVITWSRNSRIDDILEN